MEDICTESTSIARANGIDLSIDDMIEKTKIVIKNTSDNFSSMLQSIRKNQKTEIDSINGKLAIIGKAKNVEAPLNNFLNNYINSL